MLYNLLCLIVLAVTGHQSKKPILAAIIFGLIKGVGYYFLQLNVIEDTSDLSSLYISSALQAIASLLLGYGIAVITVKHPKDKELMVVTLVLSVFTFLTTDLSLSLIQ